MYGINGESRTINRGIILRKQIILISNPREYTLEGNNTFVAEGEEGVNVR